MSRIGKRAVPLPQGVTATTEGETLRVKGPKGELSLQMRDEIASSRVDTADAQRHQQPGDPVAVPGPFGDQNLTLTIDASLQGERPSTHRSHSRVRPHRR